MATSEDLQSRYPWMSAPFVVGAPMATIAGPKLAVSISSAGGLGFIGPGANAKDILANLEEASSLIQEAYSSSPIFKKIPATNTLLPIGLGFLLWRDDLNTAISAIEKFNPCAVWLYAPNQNKDLDEWSHKIRTASPQTQIWIQIGTIAEAKAILKSPERPNVLVVQGSESGGHGRAMDGIGLLTLLPEVSDVMAQSQIAIFAAGGIVDGRGVAAAICLGASGVVMGTRFLATHEARVSQGYKDEVVRATDGAVSTTRTLLYNHLRDIYGWPEEYSPRVVINKSFIEYQAGTSFEELKRHHDESSKLGDGGWGLEGKLGTYAGASIGLIHGVKHAKDVFHDVQKEALERIRSF